MSVSGGLLLSQRKGRVICVQHNVNMFFVKCIFVFDHMFILIFMTMTKSLAQDLAGILFSVCGL
jgi:hypothetical protein